MKIKITENQLETISNNLTSSNLVNESGFWSGLRKVFTGSDFSDYVVDLENLLFDVQQNIYKDKDIIAKVRELYVEIQNSDLDRRDKRELLSIMYNLYNILENANRGIEREISKLRFLGR